MSVNNSERRGFYEAFGAPPSKAKLVSSSGGTLNICFTKDPWAQLELFYGLLPFMVIWTY